MARVSQDKQPIKGLVFEGTPSFTISYIDFELNVGPMRAINKFPIIGGDCPPTTCCLGSPVSTGTSLFHLLTTNVWSSCRRGKNPNLCHQFHLQQNEAYFSKATFFDELLEDEEVARDLNAPLRDMGGPRGRRAQLSTTSRPHPLALFDHQGNKGRVPTISNLIERNHGTRSA